MKRAVVLFVSLASLTASAAAAQDFGPLARRAATEGDVAPLQSQVLAAQAVCRDAALAQARADRFAGLFTKSIAEMVVEAGIDAATHHAAAERVMNDRINDCMAQRGFVPTDDNPEDGASVSGGADPWSTTAHFGVASPRGGVTVISSDGGDGAAAGFAVRRF